MLFGKSLRIFTRNVSISTGLSTSLARSVHRNAFQLLSCRSNKNSSLISRNFLNGRRILLPIVEISPVASNIRHQSTAPSPEDVEKLTQLLATGGTTGVSPALKDEATANFISDSPICHMFGDLMTSFHDVCGLEWWSTIIITGLLFRVTVCLPIKIYQEHIQAKVALSQPIINERLRSTTTRFLNQVQLIKQRKVISSQVYRERDVQPWKIPIASLIQLPAWVYISGALRNLCKGLDDHSLQMEQLSNSGFLWIEHLTQYDPTYILPGLFFVFSIANLNYYMLMAKSRVDASIMMKARKYLSVTLMLVMTALLTKMHAAIGLFWLTSNASNLVETALLDSITIRRLLGLPKTPFEPENIYLHKYNQSSLKRVIDKLNKTNAINTQKAVSSDNRSLVTGSESSKPKSNQKQRSQEGKITTLDSKSDIFESRKPTKSVSSTPQNTSPTFKN